MARRLAQLYEHMRDDGDYSPDAKAAGRRALRNACLRYLTAADDEAAAGLADAHYRSRRQHDRHDRRPGGADPHGKPAARRRLHPFP